MSSINLQYHILKDDYAAFYNYNMWASSKQKKQRYYNIAKQVVTAAFYLAIYYYAFKISFSQSYILIAIGIYIIVTILSLFSNKNALDKQLRKFLDHADNQNIFVETILIANYAELWLKTDFSESKIKWNAIVNKVETDTHYFLHTNNVQAIIIPKRAFINNEQKIAFDKILSGTLSLTAQLNDELKDAKN
jgi:YcxB-like protein